MENHVLIKTSGDLTDNPETIEFIRRQSEIADHVVVLVGGGTDITDALGREGIESRFINGTGRVIESFEGRQLARKILEENQKNLQDRLAGLNIHVVVEIPVFNLGSVLCHANGDIIATAFSVNFDRTYVLTLPGRDKVLEGHNIEIIRIHPNLELPFPEEE